MGCLCGEHFERRWEDRRKAAVLPFKEWRGRGRTGWALILPQGAADSEKSALGSPWKDNPGDAVKPERVYGEGRTLKMTQPFL